MQDPYIQLVKKHFDAVAESYDRYAYISQYAGQELIDRQKFIKKDVYKLLNLGSGTGYFINDLIKIYPKAEISLLDVSMQMLKTSKRQRAWYQRLLKPIGLHHANALVTGLQEESIELIFSNMLLPYVNEPNKLFTEIQRILSPGGVFCFTALGPDTLKEMQSILSEFDAESDKDHQTLIKCGNLVDMHILGDELLQAGFTEPVMDVEHVCLSFSSFESLWDELYYSGLIWGSYAGEHKNRIRSMYEKHRSDANWPVTIELIYGQAWANSNQKIKQKAEFQRDGVFTVPLDQLKRR